MSQNAALRMEVYQLRKVLEKIAQDSNDRQARKLAREALAANDIIVRDPA